MLEADVCEIYTDVEGIFTTDPRLVKEARKLSRISYDEMLELTSLGGGKMHSRSIEFAKKYRVPVQVRPSYSSSPGTLIAAESEHPDSVVTGVALVRDEARVSLNGIPDRPGVMKTVFAKMSQRKIPIDMVVQDVGRGGTGATSRSPCHRTTWPKLSRPREEAVASLAPAAYSTARTCRRSRPSAAGCRRIPASRRRCSRHSRTPA